MSDVLAKRQHSQVELVEPTGHESKKRETSKKTSKPGRKPLDTEPKNKRTAQNRAAQRAFRERKEQKMKDLEARISSLETEKKNADTEAEFLRVQVQMLMGELAKHRGTNDLSDLNLPTRSSTTLDTSPSSDDSTFSPHDSGKSVSSDDSKIPEFSFEFPWNRKNTINTPTSTSKSPIFSSASNIPTLSSNASTTTTSSSNSPFELYNTDDQKDLPLFNQVKNTVKQNQDFDFNSHFDEGISEFCTDLSSACGTKECPIPKSKSQTNTPLPVKTPVPMTDSVLFNDHNFIGGYSAFDPSLAFDNSEPLGVNGLFDEQPLESDPLAGLTTEESMYDPFGLFSNSTAKSPIVESVTPHAPIVPTPQPQATAEDEMIPAKESKYLKCTEIWDRITSHPKYSDLDIDGLCNELRAKAKCSDKGVVINYMDVNDVIEKSLTQ